jgi:hypothetical protein
MEAKETYQRQKRPTDTGTPVSTKVREVALKAQQVFYFEKKIAKIMDRCGRLR